MQFDFNGALFALSYSLDCVEHDVFGITTNHGKRVAAIAALLCGQLKVYQSVSEEQVLSACCVMHDCALSEDVQEEYGGSYVKATRGIANNLGRHCKLGEESMKLMPFAMGDMSGAVLYHHENADGSGPFHKKSDEIPLSAKILQIADTVDLMFDLSWIDDDKRERMLSFLEISTGRLFDDAESEAFQYIVLHDSLEKLRNEKIDLYLHELLPGGNMECTPTQLMNFASVFARITDYKSHFTKTHSIGIAQKAYAMAVYYGASDNLAAKLYFAGALHDIGKLVVDRDVLEKPAKLNAAEYKHIQSHAYYTFKILSDIPGIEDITHWASYHHEKLDGSGYPFGLTGDKLGKWERMMACLDIYQALTEERPYKKGMSHDEAMGIMKNMVENNKLDGNIVRDMDDYFGKKAQQISF